MTDETTTGDEWAWADESTDWVPPAVDESKPSSARMYDYFLGGKDNFDVDRAAAETFLANFPGVREAAQANRAFLIRSIQAMTAAGIDQFLDLGAGIPTSPSVHEIARRAFPDAGVVYVDNDPIVTVHNRALRFGGQRVITVRGDLRKPDAVLNDPEVRAVLDLDRPIGLLMIAVLHFVEPTTAPRITGRYFKALAPGSQVAVTIGVRDGVDPQILAAGEAIYARTSSPVWIRTLTQLHELLDGTQIVEPGIEDVHVSESGRVVGVRTIK